MACVVEFVNHHFRMLNVNGGEGHRRMSVCKIQFLRL